MTAPELTSKKEERRGTGEAGKHGSEWKRQPGSWYS